MTKWTQKGDSYASLNRKMHQVMSYAKVATNRMQDGPMDKAKGYLNSICNLCGFSKGNHNI